MRIELVDDWKDHQLVVVGVVDRTETTQGHRTTAGNDCLAVMSLLFVKRLETVELGYNKLSGEAWRVW